MPTISFVRLKTPTYFPETFTETPTRILLVLLAPKNHEIVQHLNVGCFLSKIFSDGEFRLQAGNMKSKGELMEAVENQQIKTDQRRGNDERSNLITGKSVDNRYLSFDPLLRTNRLWGGLISEFTRRMPQYKSDILDGLDRQVVATAIFLYFGVLSTAITFGGLMSNKTNNLMGISETLLATSLVGIVFHLLAAQPLIIVGGTGPLLLFDEALFQLCQLYDVEFLTVRIYVGIWLGVIAVAIAAFDGCAYIRLLTRFTQELFSLLVSLIFMAEALYKVIDVFKLHPIAVKANDSNVEAEADLFGSDNVTSKVLTAPQSASNTALFCAILSVGTFVLAYCLRAFRNSHFLGRNIRRAIGDFGVPISILVFVYLSHLVPQIYTEKLLVPEGLSPTDPSARSWLISFNIRPLWLPFISAISAMLVYVLIFMETEISELILNGRGLKKGSGFHLDIVIICLMNVVCGFLGMPWQSGATIRSVTHVSAVTSLQK